MAKDIYQKITDQIVSELENGNIPWKRPWKTGPGSWPTNLKTGRKYNGINVMILGLSSFASSYWLTYNQAKSLGGHVKRGEKSTEVVFWSFVVKEVKGEDGETAEKRIPFVKSYRVFNAEQCEGLKRTVPPGVEEPGSAEDEDAKEFNPIEACEEIAAGYKGAPEINFGSKSAFYRPLTDSIHLPSKEAFGSEEEFYSTMFHEMAHSTGSKGRLSRDGITGRISFGSAVYSEEELVAEFAAAFLCGVAGIVPSTVENSAAYIRGWLKKIKSDKKLAIMAAAKAQKAADWILGEKR